MLFQPAIIALLLASLLSTLMVAGSVPFAVRVVRKWNLADGSEAQLAMERRTYLVSTLIKLVLVAELAALVLFVFNADRMAGLFTGAMCAVGTLKVDPFGFPALYLKLAVFFLAAAWLALNHVDTLGWDYPLVRIKYAALLALAPLLVASAAVQLAYFMGLRADVITSCCSTLFGGNGVTVTSNALNAWPHDQVLLALAGALALVAAAGAAFLRLGRGGRLYALVSGLAVAVGLAAVVSTISVYVYELPHHHCPFCLLKAEYGHIGYALYGPLFIGGACGVGAGIAGWARRFASLAENAPRAARVMALWSLGGFAMFTLVSIVLIARSNLILFPEVS